MCIQKMKKKEKSAASFIFVNNKIAHIVYV